MSSTLLCSVRSHPLKLWYFPFSSSGMFSTFSSSGMFFHLFKLRSVLYPLKLSMCSTLSSSGIFSIRSSSNLFSIQFQHILYLRLPWHNRHPHSVRYVAHSLLLRHSLHRRHFDPFHDVSIYCTSSLVCQTWLGVDPNIGT